MSFFAEFLNQNKAVGLPANSRFQAGVSDIDNGRLIELGVKLPWTVDPATSWLAYSCWIEVLLDAGLARHKPLPQAATVPDTLASYEVYDPSADKKVGNVNLVWQGQGEDVIQRMSTSTYTFILKGMAQRAGYQIPVPGLVTIAGVKAYPAEKQWSLGNRLVGNFGGIPVFENAWELWYYVALPPKDAQVPPPNLAQHMRGDVQLPPGVRPPWSPTDRNSTPQNPNVRLGNNPNQSLRG